MYILGLTFWGVEDALVAVHAGEDGGVAREGGWDARSTVPHRGTNCLVFRIFVLYIFVLYLYCICIVFVLYLYYICITFVLYLYCIVIIFVLYNKRGHKLPEKMCSKQTCSTQNLCLSFLMVTDHWSVTRPPTVLLFPFSLPLSKVTNSWDRSAVAFSKAVSN